jgi:ribonuclease D
MIKYDTSQPYNSPNLVSLLLNRDIQKIFHYARFDVATLRHHLNIPVINNVYCTKIASKLCRTYTDSHGLRTLVRELCGVDLDKEQQSSNWASKSLTEKQLRYAANDVLYLHRMRNELQKMLQNVGRESIANDCFDFVNTLCKMDLMHFSEQVFNH